MNNNESFDIVVIGGGPAGYVAAIRAAQLKAKVCLIEQNELGGTCLNVGCIPTKAIQKAAKLFSDIKNADELGIVIKDATANMSQIIEHKNKIVNQLVTGVKYLLKKNKISFLQGKARLLEKNKIEIKTQNGSQQINAAKVILAVGSNNFLPNIPGLNGSGVIDSTKALSLMEIPESMVIIGGGVIGCEFACIYNALGCKVTIIELLPSIIPNMDQDVQKFLQKQMKSQGINIIVNAKVLEVMDNKENSKTVKYLLGEKEETINVEKVFVSVGRKPNSENLGLEEIGVNMKKGWIQVDGTMETSVPGIFAAGDITGQNLLAHVASEEGIIAAENALGLKKEMNYKAVPKTVFTFPEIGSVGLTEQEAKDAGYDVVVGKFNLQGNGKSLIAGESGLVKIVAEKKYNEILGVHMIGPQATELIAEATLAISMEATLDDLNDTIHAHPSVSEAIKEASLDALGRAIHC